MRFVALTITLVLVLTGAACGGSDSGGSEPSDDPGEFIEQFLNQFLTGQYGRAWDTLHPVHQDVVSRGRFEDCLSTESETVGNFELVDFEVMETYEDPIDVEDIPQKSSTAVTYKATLRQGEQEGPITDTAHLVEIDGDWRWILEGEDVRAYEAGDCPGA